MEPISTLAIGVDLHLTATKAGGRQGPLLGGTERGDRFTYRPNWGLPGWPDGDQTAAPVLGFSRTNIHPGEDARAVLVPLFPEKATAWRSVTPGASLRMYEGSRICGVAIVKWCEPTHWPVPQDEADKFAERLRNGD